MTTVAVLTPPLLVAAWFFANTLRLACDAMTERELVPKMLTESRFRRRKHRITRDKVNFDFCTINSVDQAIICL